MLNPHICSYCANAYKETCVNECAPTGNYCAFEPRPLQEWESSPVFPLAAFLEMTAREARVLMGLYLFWHSQNLSACHAQAGHAADGRLPSLNGHRWPSANNRRYARWPANR